MKLSQLVAALPSLDTPPPSDPDITLITTDSRKVIPGALFVGRNLTDGIPVPAFRPLNTAAEVQAAAQMGGGSAVVKINPGAYDRTASQILALAAM